MDTVTLSCASNDQSDTLVPVLGFPANLVETEDTPDLEEVSSATNGEKKETYLAAMGLPKDRAEYNQRFEKYEVEKQLRMATFARKSISSYKEAKLMYYEAYRLIAFTHMYSMADIKKLDPSYDDQKSTDNLRKIVIVLRKVGQACYCTNELDMGIKMCNLAIEVAGEPLKNMTWFAHSIICWIHTKRKEFGKAAESLRIAQSFGRGVSTLDKTRVNLDAARAGRPLIDGWGGRPLIDGWGFLGRPGGTKIVATSMRCAPFSDRVKVNIICPEEESDSDLEEVSVPDLEEKSDPDLKEEPDSEQEKRPMSYYDYMLREASRNGHIECVKALLDHGLDVHAQNDDAAVSVENDTPLERLKEINLTLADLRREENEIIRRREALELEKNQLMKDFTGDDGDDNLCVICLDRVKSVALMPCKHMCICNDVGCSNGLQLCPLCRTEITDRITLFV